MAVRAVPGRAQPPVDVSVGDGVGVWLATSQTKSARSTWPGRGACAGARARAPRAKAAPATAAEAMILAGCFTCVPPTGKPMDAPCALIPGWLPIYSRLVRVHGQQSAQCGNPASGFPHTDREEQCRSRSRTGSSPTASVVPRPVPTWDSSTATRHPSMTPSARSCCRPGWSSQVTCLARSSPCRHCWQSSGLPARESPRPWRR